MPNDTTAESWHLSGHGARIVRRAAVWGLRITVLPFLVIGVNARTPGARTTERFLPPHEELLTQYRAYRRMHARNERFGQEAWLEAWTEYDRRRFRYTIVSERGAHYVRARILREVLRREQELIAAGEDDRADFTADNYEFQETPADGQSERYVRIKPRRKDVLLVDGRMVFSPDGRELLRVEGRLSRNPSFWTSLVNVIQHFATLDGVRVPVSTESTARLRLAGTSYFDARYEYETINGRPVSPEARQTIARGTAR